VLRGHAPTLAARTLAADPRFSLRMHSSVLATLGGRSSVCTLVSALVLLPAAAAAQTDYYNTDTGRPVRIEDAYAVERYALDLHLAPLRFERRSGVSSVAVTPELTYGLVPRTQIEIGVPVLFRAAEGDDTRIGIGGIDVTALYNVNAETQSLPAFGFRAGVLMPVGDYGPERIHPSVTGLATRTFRWARVHANAQYTFGREPETASTDGTLGSGSGTLTRWLTGLAADRAFAYRSLLATAEAYAAGPVDGDADVEWTAATGLRYQLTPVLTLDGGVGRRLTGPSQAWFFTLGVSRTSTVRFLFPGRGAWGR
jgi:hypothetical protein